MRPFTRKPLACQELVELVTAYFDGGLSRSDRRRFRRHISGCDNCTAYVEQMRLVIEASGRLTEDDLEPAARRELLEAFRGWRDERGQTA
jgi:anti-sigma factor RsiW